MATLILILKILGALGVFLYGMKVMSEGIQRTAGDRMRRIMSTMTRNRFAGVGTGILTTGLIQSSSATTVMVVSFVNAGLLTLVESIGVIMGANLGTTLTAWIIATVGKFSLSKVALPIIGVGLPLFFVGKNRLKSFGETLIGFGLLFYGLHLLKDSVPDVQSMLTSTDAAVQAQAQGIQEFVSSISGKGYLSILLFLVVGIILTLVVQSSSAAMAITVTLAIQGWIGFEESAAIVLGENIGTTVTAWLASVGTSTNAKRAARAHFLFNVLGVLWVLILFFPFLGMVGALGDMLPEGFRTEKHDSDVGFKLAIFHSLFNFLNILALIWFVPQIANIVTKWVKSTDASEAPRLRFLTGGMVDIGELNIPEAEKATLQLGEVTREMFKGYLNILQNSETDLGAEVNRLKKLEDDADVMTHDITEYLVKTSAAELSGENARSVSRMLRIVSELEEVSDAIYRLVQITQKKYTKNRSFNDEGYASIMEFSGKIVELIDLYMDTLANGASEEKLRLAEAIENTTDKMRKQFNKRAMRRMSTEPDSVKVEMIAIDMNNQFELIANYGLNVVQTAFYIEHEGEVPEKYDT
ncbi:Na/Pi cotransporter family protein [Verrucomicrobiales bacterium BCK34]|nr:Na/Pi cotransporter family protein [Verrucomicrobiales bacterium BCK34]